MNEVPDWVKELVAESFGSNHLRVGMVTVHPHTGRIVKIVSGDYWTKHGISNFWHWREVLPDGSLSDVDEKGYGWQPKT